jgi:ADP-ribose pyrophosphatase YjhB (NUDIX family)
VCGTIFYQNPLPAAGALVLDDLRRVLLVKRKYPPSEGMWCLPIGFAELGETIAEAALRELLEETGVTGRVVRLIDADSWKGVFYGDVLVVTFEVEKLLGSERAADDAEEVDYFPIDQLPPLAFPHNEKAIQLCADLHRDEWAIHDSFRRLEEAAGAGRSTGAQMLSDTLIGFVNESIPLVARLWLADVRSKHTTAAYMRLDPDSLLAECTTTLQQLGRWLEGESTEEHIRRSFRELGARRQAQGVPLHELLSAIMLLKRQMWAHARSQGVWQRPMEMYRVMELQSRFAVFFDRAMYHSARGYAGGQPPSDWAS